MSEKTLEQLTEEIFAEIGHMDENAISEYIDEILGLEYALDMDVETLVSDIEDNYQGQWNSGEDFAIELIESTGELPGGLPLWIANHIDYSAIWDCELIHDYTETSSGYFFRNN